MGLQTASLTPPSFCRYSGRSVFLLTTELLSVLILCLPPKRCEVAYNSRHKEAKMVKRKQEIQTHTSGGHRDARFLKYSLCYDWALNWISFLLAVTNSNSHLHSALHFRLLSYLIWLSLHPRTSILFFSPFSKWGSRGSERVRDSSVVTQQSQTCLWTQGVWPYKPHDLWITPESYQSSLGSC